MSHPADSGHNQDEQGVVLPHPDSGAIQADKESYPLDAGGDPLPLAGYRLGYLSYEIPLLLTSTDDLGISRELDVFPLQIMHPDIPKVALQLRKTLAPGIKLLERALDTLAPRIGKQPRTGEALERVIQAVVAWYEDLGHMAHWFTAVQAPPESYSALLTPTRFRWHQLPTLVGQVFFSADRVSSWCRVGLALGQYLVNLNTPVDTEFLPDSKAIENRVMELPEQDLQYVPLLASLVRLANEPIDKEQGSAFEQLAHHQIDFSSGFRSRQNLGLFVQVLHEKIQDGLKCMPHQEGRSDNGSSVEQRPSWNKKTFRLYYQGRLARNVRGEAARNVIQVLDAFEKQGWPDSIDNPLLSPGDNLALHQTIKSLNKGLKGIRFRANGLGTGIIWDPVDRVNNQIGREHKD